MFDANINTISLIPTHDQMHNSLYNYNQSYSVKAFQAI